MRLSALVVVHNEEERLAACLDKLSFADEIVVVLDKCTDGSKAIAARFTDRLVEGSWDLEGPRRNTGIDACSGDWILEVDADEHAPADLGREIRALIDTTPHGYHILTVDNWVGERLVRYGWGASFGKAAYPGLFRKGAKRWGNERVHPKLTLTGSKGPALTHHIQHYVDRNISDMIRRFDAYTTARARDLRDSGDPGSAINNVRRIFSRFWRCFVRAKGYREGGYGFLIAILAALYPYVSYLKAKHERE